MQNAGEGGAYGIALLALYRINKNSSLEDFLDNLFANNKRTTVCATQEEKDKFMNFMSRYKKGLEIAKCAGEKF